jgi:hypothetical protein
MGGLDVDPIDLEDIGGKLFTSAGLVDRIIGKVKQAVEILTTEIDRQGEITLPRIG